MSGSPFERIIARLVKELLNENECMMVYQDNFEKARRNNDQAKMHYIEEETRSYQRRIAFIRDLLGELNK